MTWRKEAFRQPQWRLLEDEIREQRTAIQLGMDTGAPLPQTQKPAGKRSSGPSRLPGPQFLDLWSLQHKPG